MASVPQTRLTVSEFLAREASASQKNEFYRGEAYAMAGASPAHNRIASNIHGNLFQQLAGKPCRPNTSDVMVKAGELYTYPDASVVCPPIEREAGAIEVLLNPKVLVEVLSPSTERYDRNFKLPQYEQMPSVKEILIVQQDAPMVELYVRQGNTSQQTRIVGLEGVLVLASIDCRLQMNQIYDGVEFPLDPFPDPYPRISPLAPPSGK